MCPFSSNCSFSSLLHIPTTPILSTPSIVEQLVSHMQNNGIAAYNKEEFDAFLEKNSDSIQALFNNAKKEALNGIPTIQIKDKKEYSIFLGDAYQHQERVIDGIGYANTYYYFYIYDLDEEGFPTPKYKIPINERNKRLIRDITRGKRLSKKDRALADSLLLTEIQSTTKGSVLPHFLELSTSNGAIQDMASETVEHRTERERLDLSNVNATSNTDSEAYRRESTKISREIGAIILNAKKKNTLFKAPNGRPSNLSSVQWIMVRTKNFKNKSTTLILTTLRISIYLFFSLSSMDNFCDIPTFIFYSD